MERVLSTILRYGMFRAGDRVGVAVSGGADSLALLQALVELAPRLGISLNVLHLDHMLRGAESLADAAFVREWAARLGLLVHFRETDVARLAETTGDNLEQAARRARQDFFLSLLGSGQLDRVALGHTRSDQAETVLFRFLRGAGSAGLAGIRPVTANGFVRPLIDISRAEVQQYLRDRGIGWREDSSNLARAFARNRIRLDLLPMLTREWNPALPETLAHTAEWAQAEEAWWEGEIARLAGQYFTLRPPAVLVRADHLRDLPLAVSRRLLRRAVEIAKGDLRGVGFEHIEGILALVRSVEGSGRLQIPGLDVYRSFEWLRLAPLNLDTRENRNFRVPLAVPGRVPVPYSDAVIQLELIEKSSSSKHLEYSYNKVVDCLDWGRVSGSLELRNWRPGDQYRPAGHHGPEKIKTLFQQSRIPLWERRTWPVITGNDGGILWTRRFGPASEFAADSASRTILEIREVAQ